MSEHLHQVDGGTRELMETQVSIVGVLPLGHEGDRQIASDAITAEQQTELFEEGRGRIVSVDSKKAACCIDGRCALCTAKSIALGADGAVMPALTAEKVPVLAKVPGGTYHFATLMALVGNWSVIEGATTYEEARPLVEAFLRDNGYEDAAHTAATTFDNPDKTGCGAGDSVEPAFEQGAAENANYQETQQSGPLADTMAKMYGFEDGLAMIKAGGMFKEVRDQLTDLVNKKVFSGYRFTKYRDELKEKDGGRLEILEADADHPTSLHREQGVGINEIEGTTLDRDNNDGKLFWYDRWFARQLAADMGATAHEQERLLMAADYATIMITDRLVAKNKMPAAVYTPAA